MGSRKKDSAEARKLAKREKAVAYLRNVPTSPRKMRLVADMIRGVEVQKALFMLQHTGKEAATRMEKLLRSALANWQAKNEGGNVEASNLVVKEVHVDGGRSLKRVQPSPQGRAHRIRKRSNHVTLVVDSKVVEENA
jgi:large subunit ribosomal protein L22